ncbi:uncharacterized protein LOC125033991 isoform X2 [Penaeus chinensis]|uniref:uncharacterized protein LOC125033991 isoform X2 n=1 Tax=Penaeus chinensis TaxID=139456 RepID=UPI001FB7C830|nr:uncharacterized protein LOC125033991 isoform X2 [Penaeus chinensis]
MRRRCPSPGAAQQVLLVSAVVMALTLYYRAPAIAVLHSAAPAARADQAPPPASTEAPRAKAAARKGGRTGIRAGWDDEAAADGDFPISLERDTGGDSFASKFMMALDFLTKEKERKTKATTHPPPRPSSDRSRTASTVPWNQDTGKETKHTEGTNPQPDTKANTIPAAKPAVSPGPQARACRVAFPPLDFCECKREILAQGGAACPATEGEGETTPRDLLAALNRTLGSSTCSDAATLRGANQSVISFSLFGAFPSEYHDGVPVVVARAAEAYPGWAVRVYHDLDLAKDLSARAWVCSLACKFPHLDFCSVGSLPVFPHHARQRRAHHAHHGRHVRRLWLLASRGVGTHPGDTVPVLTQGQPRQLLRPGQRGAVPVANTQEELHCARLLPVQSVSGLSALPHQESQLHLRWHAEIS